MEAAGEPQRIVPLAEVEAERAWLAGRLDPSVRHLRDGYALVERVGRRHGRLARWLQEAGVLAEVPPGVSEPYRAELEGTLGRRGGDVARSGACPTRRRWPWPGPVTPVGTRRSRSRSVWRGAAGAAPAGLAWRLDAQELGLGGLELLVGQEALGLEVAEALQPADHVRLRRRRRRRSWGGRRRRGRLLLGHLGLVGLLLLGVDVGVTGGVLLGLAALHAPTHGGGGAGDDRGAGDAA